MEERLRLQYSEDTNYIIQIFGVMPYIIIIVYNTNGKLIDLIIEQDEYI